MRFRFEIILEKSRELNLLQLIPEKFHSSQILKDLIVELGFLMGDQLIKIEELNTLQDPDKTPFANLHHLASLIGLKSFYSEETDEVAMRKELTTAIDWFKLKGTYQSLDIISYITGATSFFTDFYTNDYTNFVETDWFAGEEDENPPGLDATYYKSPHFGYSLLLDKEIIADDAGESDAADPYLWLAGVLSDLTRYVEQTRPVNTVPHFILVLELYIPLTAPALWDSTLGASFGASWVSVDETGYDSTTGIAYGRFVDISDRLRFDERLVTGGEELFFDQTSPILRFDQYSSTILDSIDEWKLGTGNEVNVGTVDQNGTARAALLAGDGFDLETAVLTGTRADLTFADAPVTIDGISYFYITLTIPQATVQSGITECGLYAGGDLLYAWLFADIDKEAGMELQIRFYIEA